LRHEIDSDQRWTWRTIALERRAAQKVKNV